MHDRNEQITRQKRRKLFVSNTLCLDTAQERRGHQHDPDSRVGQALVDFPKQRRTEDNVLLAEPNGNASRLKMIVQLFGSPLPIIPSVAKEGVTKIGHRRSFLDVFTDRCKRPHLGRRVHDRRTCSRPSRLCRAAGSAAAPAAATVTRRRVRRGRVRLVAAVTPIAAIAPTASRAVGCRARCAMATYWCRASSHVEFLY